MNFFLTTEENFECITREELLIDLKHYQKLAENIKINLFVRRNCDGSSKEYAVLEEVLDQIDLSHKEVSCHKLDSKSVIKNLDFVINSIKELQQRKYVSRNNFNINRKTRISMTMKKRFCVMRTNIIMMKF